MEWQENVDFDSLDMLYAMECEGDLNTRMGRIWQVIKILKREDCSNEAVVYDVLQEYDLLDLTAREKQFIESNL